jgi:hypothetical protein
MRILTMIVSAIFLMVAGVAPAQAWQFGSEESLYPLVDVELKGAEDEALALGYKTTMQNFILPYALSDDGYVLIVKGDEGRYYDIEEERVAEWQQAGFLPDPFPAYEIPVIERVMSYALYLALAIIALLYIVPAIRKRRSRTVAPAESNAGGEG